MDTMGTKNTTNENEKSWEVIIKEKRDSYRKEHGPQAETFFLYGVDFVEQHLNHLPKEKLLEIDAVRELCNKAKELRDDVYEMESMLEPETVAIRMELDEALKEIEK